MPFSLEMIKALWKDIYRVHKIQMNILLPISQYWKTDEERRNEIHESKLKLIIKKARNKGPAKFIGKPIRIIL